MTEKKMFWEHPAVYFITRMMILLGMMIFWGGVGYIAGVSMIQPIWGIDLVKTPSDLNNLDNPLILQATKLIQALSSIGLFIVPSWLFCKSIQQEPVEYLKLNRKPLLKEMLIALVLVFAAMPVVSWMFYINQQITLPASFHELEQYLQETENKAAKITMAFLNVNEWKGLLINIVVIALLPAIGEELLFRGVFQNFIRHVTGKRHFAVIVTAILFSAIHFQFYGFFPRFYLGLVLGYMFLFTGNIWITILIHFVNNAFAVICSYGPIKNKLPEIMQDGYVFESWVVNTSSFVISTLLIALIYKITYKRVWYNGE